ncbi:hypothetical protein AWB71_03275 [Caballeronia peredens]|nr:hypothetical protein AWB71_03275 [Caballeronia peredens]
MKAFEMDRTLIKIVAVTPVPEFKGEKRDHGVSVTFERMFENTILDEFDPDLREALYKPEDGKPKLDDKGQESFTMPLKGVKLTARKCLSIQMPMKLRKDLAGWQVVYHRGASEQSDVKAGDVKFSDFTLVDACEGGSVMLRFKGYQKLQPEVQGYVDHMAQTEVECTFREPENKQTDLVEEADKKAKSAKKKTAAEKVGGSDDPFANSDLAQDDTRIEPNPEPQPETSDAAE